LAAMAESTMLYREGRLGMAGLVRRRQLEFE
jgi:hypothetical protein